MTQLEQRQSFRPFALMTNGQDIYFWDAGRANKRLVMGFFSPDDLENLLYLRQNQTPLTAASVNTKITNRSYQLEAVQRVVEAFEQGKRKALLVMATGTGKTRSGNVSGRRLPAQQPGPAHPVRSRSGRLVAQAISEGFEEHIPDEPCTRIFAYDIDKTKRLYAVTLQTLSNCLGQFTPGFFDLIIFDEVHRSIFNKWNEVLQYFDARMVGLTATPAAFLDRNTFLEFECYDARPTFLYGHEEAVRDGYLVDFDLYAAQTRFQRNGIKGVDLSEEERNSLIEQGLDPDAIDYSGTDLEKRVSNADTLRKQWQEIMDVCRKDKLGQLPGKTIVFAMTQEHALRLDRRVRGDVSAVSRPGAGDHLQVGVQGHIDRYLQEGELSALRHLGGHAGDWRQRARSGQFGLYATGAVAHQAGADDRPRHAQQRGLHAPCLAAQRPEGRFPGRRFLGEQLRQDRTGRAAPEPACAGCALQHPLEAVGELSGHPVVRRNDAGQGRFASHDRADSRDSYSVKLVLPQIEQVWDDFSGSFSPSSRSTCSASKWDRCCAMLPMWMWPRRPSLTRSSG